MKIPPLELNLALADLRSVLKTMTDEQRVALFLLIEEGYCHTCGREKDQSNRSRCRCWDD